MSALDLLPKFIKVDEKSRPDLRLIRYAEELGYKVSFRNDHWCNTATFTIGKTSIWFTQEIRASTLKVEEDGVERYERNPRIYGSGYNSLKNALDIEASAYRTAKNITVSN